MPRRWQYSRVTAPTARIVKRIKDVIGASLLLSLAALPMLIITLLIRRDGAPAIYGQSRVGKNGVMFRCLKFRTMVVDADAVLADYLATNETAREEWAADQKLRHDPRVTILGAFLRKTSLDELPQLINVLKGEMSLVGPRPIVRDEIARYGQHIVHYYRATPGITGLWQVSGRNNVTYEERVALDRRYVTQWSLWMDLMILGLTVPALISRNGAY